MPRSACQANSSSPASSRAGRSGRSGRGRRGPPRPGAASGSRARPRRRRPRRRCRCGCRSGRGRAAPPWWAAQARMSGSAMPWSPPRTIGTAPAARTSPTVRSIAAWRGGRVGGQHRGVAVVDDPQLAEAVDAGLEMRPRRAAGGADRARAEAGAGAVGDEVVGRRADDRHVGAGELGRVLGVGHARRSSAARRSRASPRTRASACSGSITAIAVFHLARRRSMPTKNAPRECRVSVPENVSVALRVEASRGAGPAPAVAASRSPPPAGGAPARCSRAGKKIFFGISDTGNPADFGQFSIALHKHPALIESFRTWGSDFPDSIERWQAARARPVLHITTADTSDGHEIITPRAIAQGDGDEYLIRLNKLFWAKKMRAYVRPLGEPNRCLNVYASYDCAGNPRDAAHQPLLVPARLPPHLHPRSTAAASGQRSTPAWPKPGLPPLQPRSRRPAAGADRGDLEHPARRLADDAAQPAQALLPRRRLRRLGRHRLLLRQPGLEVARPASTTASRRSRSRSPSSASPAATTRATCST